MFTMLLILSDESAMLKIVAEATQTIHHGMWLLVCGLCGLLQVDVVWFVVPGSKKYLQFITHEDIRENIKHFPT